MRKETLILEAGSRDARDDIIKEFQECISFARASELTTDLDVDVLLTLHSSVWSCARACTALAPYGWPSSLTSCAPQTVW
jgi:hypothetical protein